MSFTNSEVLPKLGPWFRPLIGKGPVDKLRMNGSKKSAVLALQVLEKQLQGRLVLVGDTISLADFYAASMVSRGFLYVLDKRWRASSPNTTQWYERITNHPSWKAVVGTTVMIDEALEIGPL